MFIESRKMVEQGNFNGALLTNERVMYMFINEPPGDQAMYNIGIIYAHYKNPGRDLKKSFMYFDKLIGRFPQSPYAWQASVWSEMLKKITILEVKSAADESLQRVKMLAGGDYQGHLRENRKILSLYNTAPPADQALFNIGLVYAHYDNPDKDYRESARQFEKLIQKYPESPLAEQARVWINVLNIIEKTKQVDIEIDKKKKELTR
ncbi:MAG: tetratricopeptide repeat protein [Nitrospirota bacterium]